MDAATFRTDFPEFADLNTYPDAKVNFWLGVGANLLNSDRWGDILDMGIELFTAHNLVLDVGNMKAGASGKVPGASSGVLSAKSIDKVSASYDTASALEEGAGHWNLTNYGTRYIRLARMIGTGGVQL